MKYIKLFEQYSDSELTQPINNFFGIDTSDIKSFQFSWSNVPTISDYIKWDQSDRQNTKDRYGDGDNRIALSRRIRERLKNISAEEFLELLKKNFDNNKIFINNKSHIHHLVSRTTTYAINIAGEDVPAFFELVRNIDRYK